MFNTAVAYDLLIGLDRSDQKADLCLIDPGTGRRWSQTIDTSLESLHVWLTRLRNEHPQVRVALIVELPALNLLGFLEPVDWISLYAINPITLQKFREAFVTSRAKDNTKDAEYLDGLLLAHAHKLKRWQPEDSQTRLLQQLAGCEPLSVAERFDMPLAEFIGSSALDNALGNQNPGTRLGADKPRMVDEVDLESALLRRARRLLTDQRKRQVRASAEATYRSFTSLGGQNGWLCLNWAWKLRHRIDGFIGGVGNRPGPAEREQLRAGDVLDCWRVEAIEPNRLMRLRAEMKMPGHGWLEFLCEPVSSASTNLTQTAYFEPRGLSGWMYWYSLYPTHQIIFSGLIRKLAERAEQEPWPPQA